MKWLITVLFATSAFAATSLERDVRLALLPSANVEKLRAMGKEILPVMARIYEQASPAERAQIAGAFYALGWKSPEAKRVLMRDIGTQDQSLRLQVQWALGRVSDDPDVVATLATIMQKDPSPLFRDKAACALASDQIHLSESARFEMLQKVIAALRDPKQQVRSIAAQVLSIQTGQSKGFDPAAPEAQREAAVKEWEKWIREYARNRS